jgi:hypothetical protein
MSVTINGDGTIGGVSAGGYGLTDADLPNGSVVQVVYAGSQPSATITTTSTSYIDSGLGIATSNAWHRCNFDLRRGATSIYEMSGGATTGYSFSLYSTDANDRTMMKTTFPYLDSPATTSSVTYNIYFNAAAGYTTIINPAYGKSEITLMEIKA